MGLGAAVSGRPGSEAPPRYLRAGGGSPEACVPTPLDTLARSVNVSESQEIRRWREDLADWTALVLRDLEGWQLAQSRRLMAQGRVHYAAAVRALEAACPLGTVATAPPHELVWRRTRDEDGADRWHRDAVSRWHHARAKGLLEWAERMRVCGQEGSGLRVRCTSGACGHERTVGLGCGVAALCHACRARRANAWRRQFESGRRVLEEVTAAHRLDVAIRGRLLTLTAPDVGTLEERIRIRAAAWRRFSKRLTARFREESERLAHATRKDKELIRGLQHYVRVEEWTPGADGEGHPHYHVWLHSVWLDREWIATGWRRDVLAAARELRVSDEVMSGLERHDTYQVDIRLADADVAAELIKYLVKDFVSEPGAQGERGDGRRIPPAVFAELIRVNAGRRRRQCSAGFGEYCRAGKAPPACPCCAAPCEADVVRVDRFTRHRCEQAPDGGACDPNGGWRRIWAPEAHELAPPPPQLSMSRLWGKEQRAP